MISYKPDIPASSLSLSLSLSLLYTQRYTHTLSLSLLYLLTSGGGVLFEELTAFDEALLALASGDEECDDDGDDCELRVKSRTDSEFDIPGFLLASV